MVMAAVKATKSIALLAWLLLIGLGVMSAPQAAAPASPLILYGKTMDFDVLRNGEKVGRHKVQFSETPGQNLSVTARFELQVTFLTIPVYEFLYRSTAVWRDGRLAALDAYIDDDGTSTTVRARAEGRGMKVSGPKGQVQSQEALYPTNHWNAGVLSQSRVLNTLSGEISQVMIAAQGRERIQAEGTWIQATRYKYSGDIDTTVWYDDDGRWVKMRFKAKNGSVIDYQCTQCGLSRRDKAAVN